MKTLETLQVAAQGLKKLLCLDYQPTHSDAIFNICDLTGRVVLKGDLKETERCINVTDLLSRQYILLILDGDNAVSRKFCIDG